MSQSDEPTDQAEEEKWHHQNITYYADGECHRYYRLDKLLPDQVHHLTLVYNRRNQIIRRVHWVTHNHTAWNTHNALLDH